MVKNEVNSILEFDILLLLSHDTVSSGDQWLGVCAPGSVYSVCMGNKLTIDEAWIQEFVLVFYVTPHTHTKILAVTELLFNTSLFYPYEDWRIYSAIIQCNPPWCQPICYCIGCLPKHNGSYRTEFYLNYNVTQSSHIVHIFFYFAIIKYS